MAVDIVAQHPRGCDRKCRVFIGRVGVGRDGRCRRVNLNLKSGRRHAERIGNPERGRQLFLNADKSQCIKCHRLGDQGERVGPDLTGLGSRFSKVYIIESILEPSRTIAPSFETKLIALKSGKIVNGIVIAETETSLTVVDNQAQKHIVAKSDIDEQRPQPISTMPEGLERRLSEEEFVDLIAFLASLKQPQAK